MEYRANKKAGGRIRVIGLGTSYISEIPEKEAAEALRPAHENGIDHAGLVLDPGPFGPVREAEEDRGIFWKIRENRNGDAAAGKIRKETSVSCTVASPGYEQV